MGFDAHFVERLTECAHCVIGVLTGKKIYLLECTTVCLHAVEHSHVNDYRSDTLQLVFQRLKLAGRLPHVSINETELNFLFHLFVFL